MDQIPEISAELLGGASLPGSKASGLDMLKKVAGAAQAVRKRLGRAGIKGAKIGAKRTEDLFNSAGNKGSGVEDAKQGSSGSNQVGRSGSGGANSTGSSAGNAGSSASTSSSASSQTGSSNQSD